MREIAPSNRVLGAVVTAVLELSRRLTAVQSTLEDLVELSIRDLDCSGSNSAGVENADIP